MSDHDEKTWESLSDAYAMDRSLQPMGPVMHPHRAIIPDDLDAIFAGRPLAELDRERASVVCKTYLTPSMAEKAQAQADREHISRAALLRKAMAQYLNSNAVARPTMG